MNGETVKLSPDSGLGGVVMMSLMTPFVCNEFCSGDGSLSAHQAAARSRPVPNTVANNYLQSKKNPMLGNVSLTLHLSSSFSMKFGKTLNRGFYYGNRKANPPSAQYLSMPLKPSVSAAKTRPGIRIFHGRLMFIRFVVIPSPVTHLLTPTLSRRVANANKSKSANLCSLTASKDPLQEALRLQKVMSAILIKRERKALRGKRAEVK